MQNSPHPSLPALRAGSGLKTGLLLACAAWCLLAPARGGLTHRYPFDADGSDVVGGADAIFEGSAFIENGGVVLSGFDDTYVELPGGLLSALTNVTIEAWVLWQGPEGQTWSRIFDFGASDAGEDQQGSGTSFCFFTPSNGSGLAQFSVWPGSGYQSDDLTAPQLPADQLTHIACCFDAANGTATLYIDGQRVASKAAVNSLHNVQDVNNWLGRSQFIADPPWNGTIYE
ncbi:MAG: LamG domain-containing protein, partial [Verrucomicrobia bacterium]|nr:LamG domain-containing protein [Verrucomicrobiota bacterium]